MNCTTVQLKEILAKHAEWLADNSKGARANLIGANLNNANLIGAYLSRANLNNANLIGANLNNANLIGANLNNANLIGADLSGADLKSANLNSADLKSANLNSADLSGANLSRANLSRANLFGANLNSADLRGANMDYSSGIPLWCGGANFKCEAKLIQQVLAHLCTLDCKDKEWIALRKAIRPFAKKSHRASDLGLVKQKKG